MVVTHFSILKGHRLNRVYLSEIFWISRDVFIGGHIHLRADVTRNLVYLDHLEQNFPCIRSDEENQKETRTSFTLSLSSWILFSVLFMRFHSLSYSTFKDQVDFNRL